MRGYAFAAAAAAIILALPAWAGTPMQAAAVCPLDGKTVVYGSTGSYSTWGQELDGHPIGSWYFPLTIPQCKGSNFPIYKRDFTPEEIKAAKALVKTPGYKAIQDESSYFVIHYVLKAAGATKPDPLAYVLLQATWQVTNDPPRYARYASLLIPEVDAMLPGLKAAEEGKWWAWQIIAANVQRQSGDFAGAEARLAALPAEVPPRVKERLELTRTLVAARDSGAGKSVQRKAP